MNSTQLTSEAIPGDLQGVMTQYGHAIWRASQFGSHRQTVVATGYSSLDRELPDGGWPVSSLNELLIQQAGIGEMRLLLPTLQILTRHRPIVLVQPPGQTGNCLSIKSSGSGLNAPLMRCGARNRYCVPAAAVQSCCGRRR